MAFDLFARGFSDDQVAERIVVTPGTANGYRREYEGELQQQLRDNPALLRNVLENTVRQLNELDQARRALWQEYDEATHLLQHTCEACGHEQEVGQVATHSVRNQILAQITRSQELRAKLLGLFGVKQEFLLHVQSVRVMQEAMIAFMRESLCAEDKVKLERMLTEELGQHVEATNNLPALEVHSERPRV